MRVFWWTGLQTGPRCWRNCWRRCRGVEYMRSEEHTSELQSRLHLVCRLLLEKKKTLVIIMMANKYAFLQITRMRFLNEWEAFKKVISRRNIRRRIHIQQNLSNLKLIIRITRT